jgi:hypothetical protein
MGNPDYNEPIFIDNNNINTFTNEQFIHSYTAMLVTFKHKENIKFPVFGVKVNTDDTIYSKEGQTFITGPEYVVAKNIGCNIHVISGLYIP